MVRCCPLYYIFSESKMPKRTSIITTRGQKRKWAPKQAEDEGQVLHDEQGDGCHNKDPGSVAKLEEKVKVLMAQQQKVLELLANQKQFDTNGIQHVRHQILECNNLTHTQTQHPATSELQESQAGARETIASPFGANLSFPSPIHTISTELPESTLASSITGAGIPFFNPLFPIHEEQMQVTFFTKSQTR